MGIMSSQPGSFEHFIYTNLCPLLIFACIFVAIILSDANIQPLLIIVSLLTLVMFWFLWVSYKQHHVLPNKEQDEDVLDGDIEE